MGRAGAILSHPTTASVPHTRPKRKFSILTGCWPKSSATNRRCRKGHPHGRCGHDLQKTMDKARKLAAAGKGLIPDLLPPLCVNLAARRQYSFSRLRGTIHVQQTPWETGGPGLKEDETATVPALDPLGLGTLVHAVLADLAAGSDDSRSAIEALVRKHAWRHLGESAEPLDEPIEMIARLAASPRWASLRAATQAHTEFEFLLAWPPGSKTRTLPSSRALSTVFTLTGKATGTYWITRPTGPRPRHWRARSRATKCRCWSMPWRSSGF